MTIIIVTCVSKW